MPIRQRLLIIPLLAVMLITTSCSSLKSNSSGASPTATSSLDGAALVQERCSMCHPASIVTQRTHTPAQWQTIVNSMIQRGAQLSPAEKASVLAFLEKNYGQ